MSSLRYVLLRCTKDGWVPLNERWYESIHAARLGLSKHEDPGETRIAFFDTSDLRSVTDDRTVQYAETEVIRVRMNDQAEALHRLIAPLLTREQIVDRLRKPQRERKRLQNLKAKQKKQQRDKV